MTSIQTPALKRVRLHGELATLFGADWQLDILTPAEAVKAIDANRPGFLRHLVESDRQGVAYRMLLGEDPIAPEALSHPFSRETFHLVPVLAGSSDNGAATVKIVVGAVIAIATMGYGLAAYGAVEGATMGEVIEGGFVGSAMSQPALLGMSYGTIAMMGVTMALSGISQLLAKTPGEAESTRIGSYTFTGPVNTAEQGGPIPVGYGELIVGSTVISSGIKVADQSMT